MDVFHPRIIDALNAHEADSSLYSRLCADMEDVNEVCRRTKIDIDRLGIVIGKSMLEIQSHFQARRISMTQRDQLMRILKHDIEEPTGENNVPVFKIMFPATSEPPPAA